MDDYYAGECEECGGTLMSDGETFWCEDCDYSALA